MDIVCPACGHMSQDPSFCPNCNDDKGSGTESPSLCPVSARGVQLTADQKKAFSDPHASVVLKSDDTWKRVHWIPAIQLALWMPKIRERLSKNGLRGLPELRVVEEGGGAWAFVDCTNHVWEPWAATVTDPLTDFARLLNVTASLVASLEELHENGFLWLNFDPLCLEEGPKGPLRFTNLDLELFAEHQRPETAKIKANFAAPEIVRQEAEDIDRRSDVFQLALFAYYWLAHLLPRGFAGAGLEAFGFVLPKLRIFAPKVPLGASSVLARGMEVTPVRRFATPRELQIALEAVLKRQIARNGSQAKIRWDLGAETRTGRTKAALGKRNEDRVVLRSFSNPERALVAVADGITTCDVGSGALASLITTIIVENSAQADTTHDNYPDHIAKACRQSAETLLAWAVEKGYRDQLKEGADLMGTTLTAAWLEGNSVSLANLGDSRAYLINEDGVEQLTVDGDLASGMLAEGAAPEHIQEVGLVGKALRECIGGCNIGPDGAVTILEDCCAPPVSRWTLLPGDILILCSDGLVEEEVFLEPATLREIVRRHQELPSQDIARILVEAADALHRLPSDAEPEGYGDNISCIVIKIEAAA